MADLRGSIEITTDPGRIDVAAVHAFLSGESYWARGVPIDTVRRAIENSLCFAALDGRRQVAFARVITDRATFAYLCDVFVHADYRGRGLAAWMLETIDAHPDLQGLRRWNLITRDAHSLYARFGYRAPTHPEGYMERRDPDVYTRAAPPHRTGGPDDRLRAPAPPC